MKNIFAIFTVFAVIASAICHLSQPESNFAKDSKIDAVAPAAAFAKKNAAGVLLSKMGANQHKLKSNIMEASNLANAPPPFENVEAFAMNARFAKNDSDVDNDDDDYHYYDDDDYDDDDDDDNDDDDDHECDYYYPRYLRHQND